MTEFSVVSASQLDRSNYDEQLPIQLLVQLHASLTNEASAGAIITVVTPFISR